VIAYRGQPALLGNLRRDQTFVEEVREIVARANDADLADECGLSISWSEARKHRLTRRELEVYRLMVEGLSNQAIADRLFITQATAKLHVRHILQKLASRSRAEAVAKWRDVLES
jgi:DNA-binding NarL/FixJ family response regulator